MPEMEMEIRGSRGPIADHCVGFLEKGYIKTNERNEAATDGQAIHDALAKWKQTGEIPDDKVSWFDAFDAMRKVMELSNFAPEATPENQFIERSVWGIHRSGLVLPGRPDYFGILPDQGEAELYDYKSGWNRESDAEGQLKIYAFDIMQEFGVDVVKAHLVRPDMSVQPFVWQQYELEEHFDKLADRIKTWDGKDFVTGSHCQYCPRANDCPGRIAKLRTAIAAFSNPEMIEINDLSVPSIALHYYEMAGMVAKAAEDMRDRVKEQVRANGGKMVTDDGTELELRDMTTEELDTGLTWDILSNGINQVTREESEETHEIIETVSVIFPSSLEYDELISCVKLSKSKVEAAIKAKAAKGKATARWNEVMEVLRKYGAANTVPWQTRLFIKKGK